MSNLNECSGAGLFIMVNIFLKQEKSHLNLSGVFKAFSFIIF